VGGGAGMTGSRACSPAGRACMRWPRRTRWARHQRAGAAFAAQAGRPAVASTRGSICQPAETSSLPSPRRTRRRTLGSAAHRGGLPDEDRERPALDEQGRSPGLLSSRCRHWQPGSSIMPARSIRWCPRPWRWSAAQVMGNDTTVGDRRAVGSFQLNVMLPVIAHSLLQSIALLANARGPLARSASRVCVSARQIATALDRNPMRLRRSPRYRYDQAAAIAKRALAEVADPRVPRNDRPRRAATGSGLLDPATLTVANQAARRGGLIDRRNPVDLRRHVGGACGARRLAEIRWTRGSRASR